MWSNPDEKPITNQTTVMTSLFKSPVTSTSSNNNDVKGEMSVKCDQRVWIVLECVQRVWIVFGM